MTDKVRLSREGFEATTISTNVRFITLSTKFSWCSLFDSSSGWSFSFSWHTRFTVWLSWAARWNQWRSRSSLFFIVKFTRIQIRRCFGWVLTASTSFRWHRVGKLSNKVPDEHQPTQTWRDDHNKLTLWLKLWKVAIWIWFRQGKNRVNMRQRDEETMMQWY